MPLGEPPDQCRLADTGLARHQHDLATAAVAASRPANWSSSDERSRRSITPRRYDTGQVR